MTTVNTDFTPWREGKQGFNLAGLLIAVVAAATGGLGLPLILAATGAFCALGAVAARDYKENKHRSAAEYLGVALAGGAVGIATGAAPALVVRAAALTLLSPLLLLTGCEVGEDEEYEGNKILGGANVKVKFKNLDSRWSTHVEASKNPADLLGEINWNAIPHDERGYYSLVQLFRALNDGNALAGEPYDSHRSQVFPVLRRQNVRFELCRWGFHRVYERRT
jgi:hypothetical protein